MSPIRLIKLKFKNLNKSSFRTFICYFMNSESKSDAYYLKTEDGGVARTYCHMENIQGCGGGGWTLVMKIDGAKVSFRSHREH